MCGTGRIGGARPVAPGNLELPYRRSPNDWSVALALPVLARGAVARVIVDGAGNGWPAEVVPEVPRAEI